jgi:hypothetical protein
MLVLYRGIPVADEDAASMLGCQADFYCRPRAPHAAEIRPKVESAPKLFKVGKATAFKYAATVRNGTEPIPSRGHNIRILRKKKQKQIENATKASVKKEMAQPRMAKSARMADLILGTARIPAKASIATDKKARQRLGLRP